MLIWKAHARMIDGLTFSPDGGALALTGHYLACRVIDATTGERRWTVSSGCTFGLSVAFAGDAVVCRNRGLAVYDAGTGAERLRLDHWCQSFGLLPDGTTAVVADAGTTLVRRYDLTNGKEIGETALDDLGAINRVAASPDGRFVALVGCKQFALLAADGRVVAYARERALSNGAFALAFAPDGRSLVFSAGRNLFVWCAETARETNRVRLDAKYFMDAAFTPDGRRVLTASKEGAVRVWDTATWACERAFAWDVGPLRAVAVSPDGHRAAAAGDSGRVVVWDLDG
jgi:WD40 repeat protein